MTLKAGAGSGLPMPKNRSMVEVTSQHAAVNLVHCSKCQSIRTTSPDGYQQSRKTVHILYVRRYLKVSLAAKVRDYDAFSQIFIVCYISPSTIIDGRYMQR